MFEGFFLRKLAEKTGVSLKYDKNNLFYVKTNARLLDITMNNGTLPGDWKRATVIPIHKGGDRSLVTNYRPVSLTSVVCKQMEHVMTSYLRQMWDKNDWLYEGQH